MKALWNIKAVREDFPALHQTVHGHPLVYFDNAATTQKPRQVIDAIRDFYLHDNANVHRGVHALSARATAGFESVRHKVKHFINARDARECIFVRGTTEGINLVARSYAEPVLKPGDEILITLLEHHSNIVPWQMVCKQTGAVLKVADLTPDGEVNLDDFAAKLTDKTRFVSISYASNALGTINPVKQMIAMAHAVKARVLLDGAQATAHLPVDVQELDCDFYAFSAHKMYGPTGIGVLWGKEELLDRMPPWQGGGEMIQHVSFEETLYADLPHKFEAGTPNISGVAGLGAAIDYLAALDMQAVIAYETELLLHAVKALEQIPGVRLIGTARHKVPVISFVHDVVHAHDIGTVLDSEGIAIRSGHHCAMPLMNHYHVAATTRISLSFYNSKEEIDRCMAALHKVQEVFA